MKRRTQATIVLACLLVGTAGAGAIVAVNRADASSTAIPPVTVPAVPNMAVFSRPATAADQSAARTGLPSLQLLAKDEPGVPADELPGQVSAPQTRLLVAKANLTLVGAVTAKADVCAYLSSFGGGCTAGWTADRPIDYVYGDPAVGQPGIVFGLMPDSVARVQVVVDGVSEDVTIGENGFIYQGNASAAAFSALIVTFKDGRSQTIKLPSTGAPLPIK